ncbi:hypothetical protein KRM28CT15_58840 [Krasilnikovia sp. M28-CT-15]
MHAVQAEVLGVEGERGVQVGDGDPDMIDAEQSDGRQRGHERKCDIFAVRRDWVSPRAYGYADPNHRSVGEASSAGRPAGDNS